VERLTSDSDKVKFDFPRLHIQRQYFCWTLEDPWHFAIGVGISFIFWITPMNVHSICAMFVIHCGARNPKSPVNPQQPSPIKNHQQETINIIVIKYQ
jgi:hypothetical protein